MKKLSSAFLAVVLAVAVVNLSGCDGDWSGGGASTAQTSPLAARGFFAMTYDSDDSKVIVFGGSNKSAAFEDTWAFDASTCTWTNMQPTVRCWFDFSDHRPMIYDPTSRLVIMFEGWNGCFHAWAYDPAKNTWDKSYPPGSGGGPEDLSFGGYYSGSEPPARWGKAIVYDSSSGRALLFGGGTEDRCYSDTWAFDLAAGNWTAVASEAGAPPGRMWHSMIYDSQQARLLVFGGKGEDGCLGDLWAFDLPTETWVDLAPPGDGPTPRDDFAMVYDAVENKVVLFGGSSDDGYLGDTWIYDPVANFWSEVGFEGDTPQARVGHQMAFDEAAAEVILFGGKGNRGYLGDTWAFDTSAGVWTELHPSYVP